MAAGRVIRWMFSSAVPLIAACMAVNVAAAPETLTVAPDRIQIGTFYDGTEARVSAETAQCDGAVIVLTGEEREVRLNRKGRVAIIWMNVAQIDIGGLPEAYIMAATDDLDAICPKETQRELGLGLESLRRRMEISSDQPLTGREFDQFLQLQIHHGTYRTGLTVEREQRAPGSERISAVLPIPSKMPPGTYTIDLYCFRDGRVVETKSETLEIERVGLPQLIIGLVVRHAAAHGVLAIIVAMAVGILMGIIFSSSPGKGH